jgi:hypothetical protein
MAYGNLQNIYYDGNQKNIAGIKCIKDLVINDLTIPLILIHYTDRYKQAHQLFDSTKDKIIIITSHSLGSVIAHHPILDNEQLTGRLYSTPSLARHHERIEVVSQHGDPIAMLNLDRRTRQLYLGNPHTYK